MGLRIASVMAQTESMTPGWKVTELSGKALLKFNKPSHTSALFPRNKKKRDNARSFSGATRLYKGKT